MNVIIEYCNQWGYRERAVSLAAEIEQTLHGKVSLVASSGGVFEVTVDDVLLYSKRMTGVFPDELALLAQLRARAV